MRTCNETAICAAAPHRTVSRRPQPAFGDAGPAPEVEAARETDGPLDGRTKAILAVAVVTPILAIYGVIGYWLYALASSAF